MSWHRSLAATIGWVVGMGLALLVATFLVPGDSVAVGVVLGFGFGLGGWVAGALAYDRLRYRWLRRRHS